MSGDLPLPPWPDARLVQCNTRTPYCGMWRVLGGNRYSSGYCATREDAVAQAWQTWERLSGVSRERWEAMGQAAEFVAEFWDRHECDDLDHFRALEGWAEEILKAALDGEGA